MIKDRIENYKNAKVEDNIFKGLEFVVKTDFSKLEDGKHIISDNMYVNIQTYETKEDADFEAHRLYADIQYIISGEEKIGVTDYSNCTTSVKYSKDADIEFLKGEGTYHNMKQGDFMILYPQDAHKPSISADSKTEVRKAVVKVRL
ncbi:MAG: YhcH/YjgK/YiaL family protein [Cyanobacteria bacterium RUI128]|nr:YhcH/YjgK/YiaL family protein [Cyanobacteria bacterium RUI128]